MYDKYAARQADCFMSAGKYVFFCFRYVFAVKSETEFRPRQKLFFIALCSRIIRRNLIVSKSKLWRMSVMWRKTFKNVLYSCLGDVAVPSKRTFRFEHRQHYFFVAGSADPKFKLTCKTLVRSLPLFYIPTAWEVPQGNRPKNTNYRLSFVPSYHPKGIIVDSAAQSQP